MKKNVIITTGVIFSLGLIVSLLFYYPGYKNRVKWNADLIETSCRIISYKIEKAECSKSCNCYQECDGEGICRQKCKTCYYSCYKGYFISEYTVTKPSESLHHFSTYYTSDKSKINVENSLKSNKRISSKYLCYYHQSDPTDVVTTKYNEKSFLVISIIFFVLTFGIGMIGLTGLAMRFKIFAQNYYYNNVKEPIYDTASNTTSSSSSSSSETTSV